MTSAIADQWQLSNSQREIASPYPQKAIALIPKKRSPLVFLSQAMAILKFNPQDDSDYIEPSHNEIYN